MEAGADSPPWRELQATANQCCVSQLETLPTKSNKFPSMPWIPTTTCLPPPDTHEYQHDRRPQKRPSSARGSGDAVQQVTPSKQSARMKTRQSRHDSNLTPRHAARLSRSCSREQARPGRSPQPTRPDRDMRNEWKDEHPRKNRVVAP